MKITNVQATWLRCPIPLANQHVSDFGKLQTFDIALVRIDTDAGITGYGESKGAVGSAANCAAIVTLIHEELRPLLIGADPRNITALWEKMYSGGRAHYVTKYGRGFPELGRRGLRIIAMSGIDIALWDIAGKALGVPCHQLMGGKFRDSVEAYASGGWADAAGIGRQLQDTIKSSGFRAVKMRVGTMDHTVDNSIARVKAAREALGSDVKLMADAHGTFDVRSAKRFCRGVEDCHLSWFEEPVSVDDPAGMAEVRAATDIPIALGESLFTRFDFLPYIATRAVDIMQPDPAIAGGITEVLRIANLGGAHHLTLAPHLWGGGVLLAAGMHLAAALPNCLTLEYSKGFNPLLRELVNEPAEVFDGQILLTDRPGLGVTVNEDFIARNAIAA